MCDVVTNSCNVSLLGSFVFGIADQPYTGKKENYADDAYNRKVSKVTASLYNTNAGINKAYNAQNSEDGAESSFYVHCFVYFKKQVINNTIFISN